MRTRLPSAALAALLFISPLGAADQQPPVKKIPEKPRLTINDLDKMNQSEATQTWLRSVENILAVTIGLVLGTRHGGASINSSIGGNSAHISAGSNTTTSGNR